MALGVLQEIVAHKREELAERRRKAPLVDVRRRAADAAPARAFLAAVQGPPIRLIAEVKGASPSAGTIRSAFDPAEVAGTYARNGAAAISVLTDARFFRGADEHLIAVRHAVEIPVLRKDFVLEPYQVYETRALGADAVLLIVAILEPGALRDLQGLATDLGMAALVEVHTEDELRRALDARPALLGINNRNLDTLETTLETTRRLRPRVPRGIIVVGESGVEERAHVEEMERIGVDAVLVGTALMRSADPASRVRELLGRS
ncbi:MAG TPA: indole-3-glycerol phosphate synthase TrpC [bacterium]|nr:indole-3-glycerol phosphate synthase TrpC [bacterium]